MGMAATLTNEPWPFEQIFIPSLTEGSMWNVKKIGPGVSGGRSKVLKDNGRTDDGLWTVSDHGELKTQK